MRYACQRGRLRQRRLRLDGREGIIVSQQTLPVRLRRRGFLCS